MSSDRLHSARRMLFQFSLYGFLKNQQYFKPFMTLFLIAFLQKAEFQRPYTMFGILYGYQSALINIFEVPSGAVADLYGRRRCMLISFSAYIVSFLLFASSTATWHLFVAATIFAVGEAFRTGTHKAMIFDYLEHEGRTDEKTRYYGVTRSWSKMGSALSVLIAGGIVFVAASWGAAELNVYRCLFLACLLPYLLQLVNFALYPKYLDGRAGKDVEIWHIFTHLFRVGRDAAGVPALRRLLVESMGFEGIYKVAEGYVQKIIQFAAYSMPLLAVMTLKMHRVAVLIATVYFAQYLLESFSSRRSDTVRKRLGGEEHGARFLWKVNFGIFALIAVGLAVDWWTGEGKIGTLGLTVAIVGFVALASVQNLWRPLHIGRFNTAGDAKTGATILSLESQAKNLPGIVLAPLLGFAVDTMIRFGRGTEDQPSFLPVALVGLAFAGGMLIFHRRKRIDTDRPQPVPQDAE